MELPEGWTEQDLTKLDESFKKDKFRHTDSLVNHSATALHTNVVAETTKLKESIAKLNGHSTQQH